MSDTVGTGGTMFDDMGVAKGEKMLPKEILKDVREGLDRVKEIALDGLEAVKDEALKIIEERDATITSLEAKLEKVRELLIDVVDQSFNLGYSQLEERLKAIIGEGKP